MTDALSRLTAALADRYTIERELGAGGMATVYLAEDLKHHRKVAVKVLRPELAAVLGGERFLKEIEVTANLQHPHILPLFDSGEADSFLYYVMPYVEGESLRERLDHEKQLSIEESVEITKAVASALDYAHRREVVHRDIKPENILLHDGQPVVADFGISLAVSAAGGTRLTETGLSLGTPQYMSPEQATGDREIDGRSDVYSLASVLYEMLAGDPPHTGSTVQAVIAKVVTDHPRPVSELRDTVPLHVTASVHKALAKLPADRFENAQSFAKALADTSFTLLTPASVPPAAVAKPSWAGGWPQKLGVAVVLAIGIALGWLLKPSAEEPPRPVQFLIRSDSSHLVGAWDTPAISPDGSVIVYRGYADGRWKLVQRRLAEQVSQPIAGTENSMDPFFSPDGEWLGFRKDRMLMKTRLDGGTPIPITECGGFIAGVTWGREDRIVFGGGWPEFHAYEVSAAGGRPEPFIPLDTLTPAVRVIQPRFLPGRDAIFFTEQGDSNTSWVHDLRSGETRLLGSGGGAKYIDSGHIVYSLADGALMQQPFDRTILQTTGPATQLEWATTFSFATWPRFDVSPGGTLVVKLREPERDLLQVDLTGSQRVLLSTMSVWVPRYSPDGTRIAYGDWAEGETLHDLWVHDLGAGTETRLTFDARDANDPVWSPDGRSIVFSYPLDNKDLYVASAEGSGETTLLLGGDGGRYPSDWTADGRYLIFTHDSRETGTDIWTLELDGDSVARRFLATEFNEEAGVVSPDGQWLAYQSNETGRYEVYIQSFPEPRYKRMVSAEGGVHPVWAPDGRALYYWDWEPSWVQSQLVKVGVNPGVSLGFGDRQVMIQNDDYMLGGLHAGYDIHPNGHELVMVTIPTKGQVVVALDMLGRER